LTLKEGPGNNQHTYESENYCRFCGIWIDKVFRLCGLCGRRVATKPHFRSSRGKHRY